MVPAGWQDGGVSGDRVSAPLQLPAAGDAALLILGVASVSMSGPLMVATAAPALAIAFWRNAFGALATGVVRAAMGRRIRASALTGREWRLCLLAGVFLTGHFATWVPSLAMTSVATSTALVATQPVFIAAVAHLQGNRLPRRTWLGIGGAVLGAALITGADLSLSGRAVMGDLLAVAGAAFVALYAVTGAEVRRTVSVVDYTTICYASCAVLLLLMCGLGRQQVVGFGADVWLKLLTLTVVAQLLGHTLFNLVLRSASPAVISIALLFEVPGAAVIAWLWLDQTPPATAWPGIGVLLGAVTVLLISARARLPGAVAD
jgi:drug/metabolite transporter (DMT)-like permease